MATATIKTFQLTIAAANTAQSLEDPTVRSDSSSDLIIQNHSSNTETLFIGDKDCQFFELQPGQTLAMSEMTVAQREAQISFSDVFVKSAQVGALVNVLLTEIK